MAMPEQDESRVAERKRVLKGAKIAFANRCSSLPCVVRDISDTGARLQVKDHTSVPDTFELLIELDGFEADAEVVWRGDGEVGIIFLSEPVIVKPKRTQVVTSHGHMRKGTLRRQGARPLKARAAGVAEVPASEEPTVESEVEPEVVAEAPAEPVIPAEIEAPQVEAAEPVAVETDDVAADAPEAQEISGTDAEAPEVDDAPEPEVAIEPEIVEAAEVDDVDQSVSASEVVDTPGQDSSDITEVPETEEAPALTDTNSIEQQDSIPMDQAIADTLDSAVFEQDAEEENAHQDAPVEDASLMVAPGAEVPMFRDQVESTPALAPATPATPEPSAEESQQQDVVAQQTEEPAAPAGPPVLIDQESLEGTVAHFQEPFRSRVKVAFQTPQRAADNMAHPEVPIVPAPVFNVDTSVPQDSVAGEIAEPAADVIAEAPEAMDEAAAETPVIESPDEAADLLAEADVTPAAEMLADVTATQEAPVDVVDTDTTSEEPVVEADIPAPLPELRADLADFISAFRGTEAPVIETATEIKDEPEVVAETPEALEVKVSETNVVAMPAQAVEDAPADVEIVDDAIMVSSYDETSEASEPGSADAVEPVPAPIVLPVLETIETAPAVETTAAEVADVDGDVAAAVAEMLPCIGDDADVLEAPVVDEDGLDDIASAPAPVAHRAIPILIAEDDPDDRMFMREAFGESDFDHDIAFVENGEELLEYLSGEGDFAGRSRPELILLDLNMPKMDGRTALLHIKANPLTRRIPVIILTTSRSEDDIEKTYDLGVSSYISKPSSAEGLKEVITTLNVYWSNLCALPAPR